MMHDPVAVGLYWTWVNPSVPSVPPADTLRPQANPLPTTRAGVLPTAESLVQQD